MATIFEKVFQKLTVLNLIINQNLASREFNKALFFVWKFLIFPSYFLEVIWKVMIS